jgi:hypothetical protein
MKRRDPQHSAAWSSSGSRRNPNDGRKRGQHRTLLNQEFANPKRTTEWKLFFAAVIAFTIISSLNLRSWG